MHVTLRVAERHLLVHDAAPGGHPLHVAGAERAAISQTIAVLHGAGQYIGDGFDAAVRVPRESREIIGRPIVTEIIEQQKRIGLRRIAEAEGSSQLDAGIFNGGLRLHNTFDGTD